MYQTSPEQPGVTKKKEEKRRATQFGEGSASQQPMVEGRLLKK
jgi:hypothetical protein